MIRGEKEARCPGTIQCPEAKHPFRCYLCLLTAMEAALDKPQGEAVLAAAEYDSWIEAGIEIPRDLPAPIHRALIIFRQERKKRERELTPPSILG